MFVAAPKASPAAVVRAWVDPSGWAANPWLRLLSLLLAVATWLYVQAGEITEQRLQVGVEWVLPTELVSVEPLPPLVYVTVRGTRASVNKSLREPPKLVVDVSGFAAGAHTIELDPVPLDDLPQSLERLSTAPPTVEFALERMAEKSLEVAPVVVGDPASGHAVGSVVPAPRFVKVRGPRTVINGLRSLATRPIDVTELAEDVTVDAPLDLPSGVVTTEPVEVQARIIVSARTEKRTIEGIPVYVWGVPGWSVEPGEIAVEVEGPAGRVAELERAELAAFVYLPPTLGSDQYEVTFGPREGPRIAVLEMSGSGVVPVGTDPPTVVASKRPPAGGG